MTDPLPLGERKDGGILPLVSDLLFPPAGPPPTLWDGEIIPLSQEQLAAARLEAGLKQEGVSEASIRRINARLSSFRASSSDHGRRHADVSSTWAARRSVQERSRRGVRLVSVATLRVRPSLTLGSAQACEKVDDNRSRGPTISRIGPPSIIRAVHTSPTRSSTFSTGHSTPRPSSVRGDPIRSSRFWARDTRPDTWPPTAACAAWIARPTSRYARRRREEAIGGAARWIRTEAAQRHGQQERESDAHAAGTRAVQTAKAGHEGADGGRVRRSPKCMVEKRVEVDGAHPPGPRFLPPRATRFEA